MMESDIVAGAKAVAPDVFPGLVVPVAVPVVVPDAVCKGIQPSIFQQAEKLYFIS